MMTIDLTMMNTRGTERPSRQYIKDVRLADNKEGMLGFTLKLYAIVDEIRRRNATSVFIGHRNTLMAQQIKQILPEVILVYR